MVRSIWQGTSKEWAWNGSGDQNWIVGGAWDDDPRMATVRFTAPPFDRSSRHGFRAAKYLDAGPSEELTGAVDLLSIDYRNAQSVSNEVYEVYRRQMVYAPSEVDANVESIDDTPEEWVREHVTIDAGYEDERFSLHIFLPKNASPPYQPLIFFTGLGPFRISARQSLHDSCGAQWDCRCLGHEWSCPGGASMEWLLRAVG